MNDQYDERLATVLEESFARIRAGELPDRVLSDCPADLQPELARLLGLEMRLQGLGHDPPPQFQARLEHTLMSAMAEQRRAQTPAKQRLFGVSLFLRPAVLALGVLLLLGIGGAGAVQASHQSLPDSPLYKIKVIRESGQLWLTREPEAQVDVHAAQLNERSAELERSVAKQKRSRDAEVIARRLAEGVRQAVDRAI
jgi:hypothetical protein